MPNWQVDERGYMALDDRPIKLSYAKSSGGEAGVDFKFGLVHGNFWSQKCV